MSANLDMRAIPPPGCPRARIGLESVLAHATWNHPASTHHFTAFRTLVSESEGHPGWGVKWPTYLKIIKKSSNYQMIHHTMVFMNDTAINWTDLTWNPVSGCTKVSAGCKYCYAEVLSENKRGTLAFPNGFDITLRPWKLDEPGRLKKASLIFTNSMTDIFHDGISDSYRDKAFDSIRESPWHRFQILTKRPEAAVKYFSRRVIPPNVWLGVTVEHQLTIGRIDILRDIDASVRFISAEPLIGHIDFLGKLDGVHWVIGGGESGSHLSTPSIAEKRGMVRRGERGERRWVPRADRYHWATDIRDACIDQRVAFWWKQWGGPTPKSAGRDLEGKTWDEMPIHVPGAMPNPDQLVPITRRPKLKRANFI